MDDHITFRPAPQTEWAEDVQQAQNLDDWNQSPDADTLVDGWDWKDQQVQSLDDWDRKDQQVQSLDGWDQATNADNLVDGSATTGWGDDGQQRISSTATPETESEKAEGWKPVASKKRTVRDSGENQRNGRNASEYTRKKAPTGRSTPRPKFDRSTVEDHLERDLQWEKVWDDKELKTVIKSLKDAFEFKAVHSVWYLSKDDLLLVERADKNHDGKVYMTTNDGMEYIFYLGEDLRSAVDRLMQVQQNQGRQKLTRAGPVLARGRKYAEFAEDEIHKFPKLRSWIMG